MRLSGPKDRRSKVSSTTSAVMILVVLAGYSRFSASFSNKIAPVSARIRTAPAAETAGADALPAVSCRDSAGG